MVSFKGQPVITEDNLVVLIDTVLFFQITDPRAADYEIVNYIQAIEQLTATMLRSVIGSMDLEQTLTSREGINNMLRGVLDEASGKWGIRVTRVEIKAIDPPKSVMDAMEKQMRAEREKRAAILTAEGARQSQILTAEGDKQGAILRAEGEKQSAVLRAEGQAQAISTVFQSIHHNDPDPKLLAYQYLQMLPQLAQGPGNTFWVIPSEVTTALKAVTSAFGGVKGDAEPVVGRPAAGEPAGELAAAASGKAIGGPAGAEDSQATTAATTAGASAGSVAGDAAARLRRGRQRPGGTHRRRRQRRSGPDRGGRPGHRRYHRRGRPGHKRRHRRGRPGDGRRHRRGRPGRGRDGRPGDRRPGGAGRERRLAGSVDVALLLS